MISNREIKNRIGRYSNSRISVSTLDVIRQEVNLYLDILITSMVSEFDNQNSIRKKVGLPKKKIIHGEILYKNLSTEDLKGRRSILSQGELGVVNRNTNLSKSRKVCL